MKRIKETRVMFDDVEQPPIESTKGICTFQNNETPSSDEEKASDAIDYLKKTLEIQRNNDAIQQKNEEILAKQEFVLQKLEECKNMTLGFSQKDRKTLDELPGNISQKVCDDIKQSGKMVKEDISKHSDETLEKNTQLFNLRLEKTKEEIGVNKGIFLSWPNFWTMIIMTVISTGYATYTAFSRCLWGELWERIWMPFTFIVIFIISICLLFYLNYKGY